MEDRIKGSEGKLLGKKSRTVDKKTMTTNKRQRRRLVDKTEGMEGR